MKDVLRILMVEDILSDADLIKYELKKGGIQFIDSCVDTKENFINALQNFKPDIILSDYSLPNFNGMQALLIKEELAPSISFILITGTLNEETAVEIIKAGADDYIIKEHLARLCSAIRTSIEKKELVRSKIKAEKDLIESEERLRIAMEVTGTGVWDWDLENDKWFASSMYYTMLGYEPVEAEADRSFWLNLAHPDDIELIKQKIKSVLEGETSEYKYEARIKHADGTYRWQRVEGFVVRRNNEGKATRMLGTRADITYRKQVEEKLLQEQYLTRSLLDNTPDRIYFKDAENRFIMMNKSLAGRMNLANPAEAVGKTDFDFFTEEHAKQAYEDEQKIIRTGLPLINIEEKETWNDGSITWASTSKFPLYDKNAKIVGTMGISRDVSERKQYEDSLRESNEFNSSLIKTIPFGIDIVDENGKILFMSEQFRLMFEGEVIGKYCWLLYRDNKTQCEDCPLKFEIKEGESSVTETENVLNGRIFQISHTGMIYKGKKAILEIFQDITNRRKSDEKIHMLANALKSISECVTITDVNDVIFYVNESFLNTYGYSEKEVIGKHIDLLRPQNIPAASVKEILPQTIAGGWRGELINKTKDGTLFPVLLSTSVVKDENEKPIALIGVAIDITELKKATEELILAKERAEQSDKLKSEFLAQISHEIRSPLNVTLNFANIIREELGTNITPALMNYFDGIESTGHRLIRTVDLIINMSKIQIGDYKPIWANFDLVRDIIEQLEIEYSASAKMKNLLFTISNKVGKANLYADKFSPDLSLEQLFLMTAIRKYSNNLL